jgi:endonuclease YncB( thermonuclease family)
MSMFGPYPARVVNLHDGDTVHLDIDLGFGFMAVAYDFDGKVDLSCRVFGINAPELSTAAGKAALAYAQTLLHPGDHVTIMSHGWDKYGGRFDGTITMASGLDFAQAMLDAGQAVPFNV